jgi:RNA polymerase sigma-70 factor (ECF subfamily)
VLDKRQTARFEQLILPHLDSAYNLARWLYGNEHDAEDAVQEASLRAIRFFSSFRGEDGRAWFLAIVRNTCYTGLRKRRPEGIIMAADDENDIATGPEVDPEQALLQRIDAELLRAAIEQLSVEFRETLILREMDGLSYKEIAQVTDVPPGTVMSRLARARKQLQQLLIDREETRL